MVLGLIEGFIEHDDESGFGVEGVEIGLHLDGDLIPELLRFHDSQNLPPIRLQNCLIDRHNLFLIQNLLLQLIPVLLDHYLIEVLLHLVQLLVFDVSSNVFGTGFG